MNECDLLLVRIAATAALVVSPSVWLHALRLVAIHCMLLMVLLRTLLMLPMLLGFGARQGAKHPGDELARETTGQSSTSTTQRSKPKQLSSVQLAANAVRVCEECASADSRTASREQQQRQR